MHLLVIPTYNRSAKLRRLLDWYESEKIAARIVVLDASSEAVHAEANRQAINKCTISVEHIPTPGQNDVAQRILRFLESISDELVAIGNDEDAFFPEFLDEAFQFLNDNPEYALATGRYVTSARSLFGVRRISYWTDTFIGLDVDESDPTLRIVNFQRLNSGGVPPLYWSVRRRSVLMESCKLEHRLRAGSAQELIDQINACASGKIRISAQPMLLRDESRKNYVRFKNRDDGKLYIAADDMAEIERISHERWGDAVTVAVRAVISWYRAKQSGESYQSRLQDRSYCRFAPVIGFERSSSLRWIERIIRWSSSAGVLVSQVCAYLYFLVYMLKRSRGLRFLKMTRMISVHQFNKPPA